MFIFVMIVTTVGVIRADDTGVNAAEHEIPPPSYVPIGGPWTGLPKTESTTPKKWIEQSIKKHNEYRKLHSAHPLVFNKTLAEIAQAYANQMASTYKVEHNPEIQNAKIGENLYYNTNTVPVDLDPDKPITAWYEEHHDYDYKTSFSCDHKKEILHFTQLVWIGSTDVGVAYAKTKKPDGVYAIYVVANYWPRGNFDDFLLNVLPPIGKKVVTDYCKNNGDNLGSSYVLQRYGIFIILFPGILGIMNYFYTL